MRGADVELVRGDIREINLRPLCESAAVIFNLAAQTSHMGGQADPLADIAVDAVAQVRLIQAAPFMVAMERLDQNAQQRSGWPGECSSWLVLWEPRDD